MFSSVKYMNQNIQWTRSTSFDGLTGVIDCVQFGPTLKEKVFFFKDNSREQFNISLS